MNTKLLTTTGKVFKIVGEFHLKEDLIYSCKSMKWCPDAYTYLEDDDSNLICRGVYEDDVEVIDSNDMIIRMAKDRIMGFE